MNNTEFETLYNEYESTKNVCKFCNDHNQNDIAIRFLLIRSLDKSNLKEIITNYSNKNTEGNIIDLTEKAYNSSVKVSDLVDYIKSKRNEIIKIREDELKGLPELLSNFPIVNCGVRNDKVDDIVKAFVRNKSIKTLTELNNRLENNTLPRIKQYILWSYYNQTSNDIIELFLLKHKSVIPTLRKIHDIDFFLEIENKIIPFDLKFTHISDSYFDLASQGIVRNTNTALFDDFYVDELSNCSEIKEIKAFYKNFKTKRRNLNLPNLAGREKNELCKILIQYGDEDAKNFVNSMQRNRSKLVPTTSDQLYQLEWWNYKYQGDRLFCNNNRLYVFLAYIDKFVDGRELKGRTEKIGNKINFLLDNLTMKDIHVIKYHYDKLASLKGDYSAHSISTIYSE